MRGLQLRGRFMFALSAIAALSIGLALVFQDHSLGANLEEAAGLRLARAADAVEQLLAAHIDTTRERYIAVSGTPQFRANLEVEDPPTLGHYATGLMRAQQAEAVLFLDREGQVVAAAGRQDLSLHADRDGLVERGGKAYLRVEVPLASGGWTVGKLVAVESFDDALLAEWSSLAGVEVGLHAAGTETDADLSASVRQLGSLELRVVSSLEVERRALAHSRARLAIAGLLGLAAALIGGALLSRGLVGPIVAIQRMTEQIGAGDLSARIQTTRRDELGEMAVAVNGMAERLEQHECEQRAHSAHLARINGELRRAKAVAELAGRARSEFLANMSHEVRTPMAAVLGYVDLLLDEDLEAQERAEFGAAIRKNGEQLLELIQRMLEAAREESSVEPIERTVCRPRALIAEALASVHEPAARKGLSLGSRVDETVAQTLRAGAGPLLEVLRSLLDNAVRFTDQGEVRLDAHQLGELLYVDVTDSGPGICHGDLERIFEPFVQVDGSSSRVHDGAGLGLAVSRRLARELGGDLTVVSTLGRGSTFSLCIGVEPAGEDDPDA